MGINMKHFYSASTNGFYLSTVHSQMPVDSVEITKDLYYSLLEGQANGMDISCDEKGLPILVDKVKVDVVPIHVSRAQGKAALIRAGLWQGVLDYVASIEDATEKAFAEVALNDTTHWQRASPFLNSAATALGLTQEQLDDLFVTASEIEL